MNVGKNVYPFDFEVFEFLKELLQCDDYYCLDPKLGPDTLRFHVRKLKMKTDIFPRNFLSPNVSSRSFLLPKSVFSPGLVSTVTCHQDPSPFITSHRSKVQPDTVNYHLTPYFCPSPVTSRLPPTLVYDTSCVSFLPPWDTPVVLNFRSQFIPPFILTPSLICFVSKDLRVQS